jgi:hypothetical protein
VKAVKTVVTQAVTWDCKGDQEKRTMPMEKHVTELTRNTRGKYWIQARIHCGVRRPGERLKPFVNFSMWMLNSKAYYIACFQFRPSKPLAAEAVLRTRERK